MITVLVIYAAIMYVVFCADDCGDGCHTIQQKAARTIFWPLTVTSWFRTQNIRLHRLLNILWTVLIAGWFISLLVDRLP